MPPAKPASPAWMVPVLLLLAAALAALLAFAAWRTLSAATPLCNPQFPSRYGDLPSWTYVFAAIAAFGLGHVAGQLGIARSGGSEHGLGEGRWTDPRAVLAVNAGVAAFLFLATGLLLYEAWTLHNGVWPITYYVRCANDAGALISLVGVAAYAFVAGRWMWVFRG